MSAGFSIFERFRDQQRERVGGLVRSGVSRAVGGRARGGRAARLPALQEALAVCHAQDASLEGLTPPRRLSRRDAAARGATALYQTLRNTIELIRARIEAEAATAKSQTG